GWTAAVGLVVRPGGTFTLQHTDVTRWWVTLAPAALIAVVAVVLRRRERRATSRIAEAHTTRRDTERLLAVTAELLAAGMSDEVARILSREGSALLGAQGGALALLQTVDELVVVDPSGLAAARPHGSPVSVSDETLLSRAVRDGAAVIVNDRSELESFPGSAQTLSSRVQAAIAVPVRADSDVIGSIGFLFDRPHAVDGHTEALVQ